MSTEPLYSTYAERCAAEHPRANPPTPPCPEGKDKRGDVTQHMQTFATTYQSDGTIRCERCGHILAGA